MALSVCPADVAAAPVERVWALLAQPARYGRFWDFTVERVEPDGAAAPGQKVHGWTRALGRRWPVEGEVLGADAARRVVEFRMTLPFGVVGHNRISAEPMDDGRSLLRFG